MTTFPDRVGGFTVDALATARLARLVTTDTITAPIRDRIIEWSYRNIDVDNDDTLLPLPTVDDVSWTDHALDDPNAPRLATLVTCSWCAGVWIAAGVCIVRRVAPAMWAPAARVLAVAAVAGLLVEHEDGW